MKEITGTIKLLLACLLLGISAVCPAQRVTVNNDLQKKYVTFGNEKLLLTLDYNDRANISSLAVNGELVIESTDGIYSEIKTSSGVYSSRDLTATPSLEIANNTIKLNGIKYGGNGLVITENWKFTVTGSDILFDVDRNVSKNILIEEASFPVFNFRHINTWEGAYQHYGGLAWFYLFNEKLATYGVHSRSSRFWNSKTGTGFTVSVDDPHNEVAMRYSRTADDKLEYSIAIDKKAMLPRFDSGTNRKRFIRHRTDVWAPFQMSAGKSAQRLKLSYFDFHHTFDRGKFVGINGTQVSAVLNTIARIGVIDEKHFGGNSWHTPYGPICLHEQYIAQLGVAINDNTYLKGYEQCLDYYRDNAIKPDGRVWARWAYNNVDIMPGQVTGKGFYETQWGYLLDSNPDLVSNVAELYDQTGNKAWVKAHQQSCEKVLDWIIKRDSDGDGLVEMMTDSYKEKKGSDWIDIIWAAYENGFVNAKLYFALTKWSAIERQLGNLPKAIAYETFAKKLKTSFNKSTKDGGLWDEDKNCYIHWRDKDNSIHGNNMVTPVNFMAIAYGLCEDDSRRNHILDEIENQMQKEKLFFWPLNLYSYKEGEGNDWQFPFPNYENGDIFLSWGAVAVKAYAAYKPELALKYVRNVMHQHSIDGLAFQRYGRAKQDGLGDDILSGNSLSVVGLYQAIYGINPLYNRFYLNPHITPELAGTELNYNFRGDRLKITLHMNRFTVAGNKFKVTSGKHFGVFSKGNEVYYFDGNNASPSLTAKTSSKIIIDIQEWNDADMRWTETVTDTKKEARTYTINTNTPGCNYQLIVNSKNVSRLKAGKAGVLIFTTTGKMSQHIQVKKI